jgi:hypothetical protein
VAYRDPKYTTSWITHDQSASLAELLQENKFEVLGADALLDWMETRVGEYGNSLVVFLQDVVPHSLMAPADSDALIRRYLDSGGTVIWIGDTPFFYPGRKDISTTDKLSTDDLNWFLNRHS